MATRTTEWFYMIDPANPPDFGTSLVPIPMEFVDADGTGVLESGDQIDGKVIASVCHGDAIVVTDSSGLHRITGATFSFAGSPAVFMPVDGCVLEPAHFEYSAHVTAGGVVPDHELGPPCFVSGTMIATPQGNRPVETLTPGDMVCTLDHGNQPLRWIGQRQVEGRGAFAPICFARGSIGNRSTLFVSPRHRMLVTGWRAELFLGEPAVLVPAIHLVNGRTIRPSPRPQVRYFHLLFDRHEVICAEGAWSESYHPGATILSRDAVLRAELAALFPGLEGGAPWPLARPEVRAPVVDLCQR
ncbi:MAG: Hint domain-containing protein [Paracoccaceae bacterium]|nr:Hint domain-containing protein [Paracoccaceae bacterium]